MAILRRMTSPTEKGGPPTAEEHTPTAGLGRVNVTWRGEQRFEFGHPGRPWAMLDGAGHAGPSPFDGLLGAIAACSAIDVVEILAKRRTPARSLDVEILGSRANGVPRRLVAGELHFRIAGQGIEREQAERAIDLAITKYCSVRSSLDPAVPITWTLELAE